MKLSFEEYIEQADPFALRWSGYLHRLQGEYRENAVTTWSYEDYPFIWREVAQAVAGLPNKEEIKAADKRIRRGMSLQGSTLMFQYLQENPVRDAEQFNKVCTAFEHKYPSDYGLPAEHIWPKDMQDTLTEGYEDDLYYIDRMEDMITIRKPDYS